MQCFQDIRCGPNDTCEISISFHRRGEASVSLQWMRRRARREEEEPQTLQLNKRRLRILRLFGNLREVQPSVSGESWPEHTDPKTQSTNHPELRQTADPRQGRFSDRLNVLRGARTNTCAWKVFRVLSHPAHFSLVCVDAPGPGAQRGAIKSTNGLCCCDR